MWAWGVFEKDEAIQERVVAHEHVNIERDFLLLLNFLEEMVYALKLVNNINICCRRRGIAI